MHILLRKIRSAARLALAPGGVRQFSVAARLNIRRLGLQLHRGRPFFYRTTGGRRFVCLPQSASSVQAYLVNNWDEEMEFRLALSWLQAGDACLDIGANIGAWTACLANQVGPSGVVVAVEPGPSTIELTRSAMKHLGLNHVMIEHAAVSSHQGQVEFMVSDGAGSDTMQSLKIADGQPGFRKHLVSATTIDALIARHRMADRLSLVKIDIEGAEPLGLAGSASLLSCPNPPLWMIEIHTVALGNFGYRPKDVFQHFPADRYDFYSVQRSKKDLAAPADFGRIQHIADPSTFRWPWLSNVAVVPRVGRWSLRRAAIEPFLSGVER